MKQKLWEEGNLCVEHRSHRASYALERQKQRGSSVKEVAQPTQPQGGVKSIVCSIYYWGCSWNRVDLGHLTVAFLLWLAILLYPNVSLDSTSLVTFLQPLVRRHARCPRLSLWTCRSTGSRQPPQGEHTEVHTPG